MYGTYYLKLLNFFIKDPEPDPEKSRPDPQHCLTYHVLRRAVDPDPCF